MVRLFTRRFAVGVLGLLAAVLAVAGSASEASAQYPYNYGYGYTPYIGQQYQQPQYQQPYQQYVAPQYQQPYQQFSQGPAIAPPFAAAPRYYYLDNRYCGDGRLFIENGINYCANTGARVFPIYPDYVPYGYGQFGYGYNQYGYGFR